MPLIRRLGSRVRDTAAEALDKLGDGRAVEPLARLLDDREKPWLADKTISQVAQDALHAIGTPEALAALESWRQRQRE